MQKVILRCILLLAACLLFLGQSPVSAKQDFLLENLSVPASRVPHDLRPLLQRQGALRFTALNPALLSLPLQAEIRFEGAEQMVFTIVHDRTWRHAGGGITWVGYLKERGKFFRAFITREKDGIVIGSIKTPQGLFRLRQGDGGIWLINEKFLDLKAAPFHEDARSVPGNATGTGEAAPAASAAPVAGNTVVDVIMLHSPGLADKYPGGELAARLDELAALSNQAYVDSGVSMTLRVVHMAEISYSETADINSTLDDLTGGIGAFADVAALRDQYGADLVSFIRPYHTQTHGGCGVAWINTGDPTDDAYGYSVISDGRDADGSNYYCTDYSFTHELGHNMGSTHERAHATYAGAYPYSYGYGVEGPCGTVGFGTIMSYTGINCQVGYFSSPEILQCAGGPCGIDPNAPDAADNALSLNNTRSWVSAFRDTVVPFRQAVNITPILNLLLGN